MTDDLAAKLLEAITETERLANGNEIWWAPPDRPGTVDTGVGCMTLNVALPSHAAHIARNDPATILRRCAADRRRLERHAPTEPGIGHFESSRFKDADARICAHCSYDGDWRATAWPCPDVVDLADSYGLDVTE